MSTSEIVNQSLRKLVLPILKDAGFQKVEARNAWLWQEKAIWVFNIRAVGRNFSEVTGWPPGSFGVWLGVFFRFFPSLKVKQDENGLPLPAEYQCHMRSHLECELDQSSKTKRLPNKAERKRSDLWWVEPDGSNADEVANDILFTIRNRGVPWYSNASRLDWALDSVENERDGFNKFVKAAFLARELGDRDRWKKFDSSAEAEAKRIKLSVDRTTWYGI